MASMIARWCSLPAGVERHRSALRNASVAAMAALLAFHGWLFAGQLGDGRLADPWLVARWLVAAGLVGALVHVQRGGESVVSRKGVAIWVLAALLHGPAVAGSHDAFDSLALPPVVTTSVLQVVIATALSIGLWLLAGLFVGRDRRAGLIVDLHLTFDAAGILAAGFSPPYSSRPPPQLNS